MMNCNEVRELLGDYVDGELDGATALVVEEHLEECPACRGELGRLRTLVADAARLPHSVEPPIDFWPAIDAAIDRRAGRVSLPRSWLAAAAVALVVTSSAVTALLVRPAGVVDGGEGAPVMPASLRTVESRFVVAVRELERELAARRPEMSQATIAVIEENLAITDAAIRETRAALAGDLPDLRLADMLWGAYRQKLDLLKRATSL